MRLPGRIAVAVSAVFLLVTGAIAQDGVHKLALQITDNDPQKMNTVLNVASNVSRQYSE